MTNRFSDRASADDVQGSMIKLPIPQPIDPTMAAGYDPAKLVPQKYKDLPGHVRDGLSSLYHGVGSLF